MNHNNPDHLRTVRFTPYRKGCGPRFTLTIWNTGRHDGYGKHILRYHLNIVENGCATTLFKGDDFCCPPPLDPSRRNYDYVISELMGFLTLRPGDTDDEYFDDYTPAQRNYCDQHAEALGCEVMSRFEKATT